MSHSPLVELPHSTSPTRRALARAREVPLSPGDGVIHFSRHRNKGTAFSRRETLILGGPIELGDENEAVAPSPAKLIRLSASPAQPAKRTATDLLLLSLDQPADATPLRRLKARENASASSSPATTPAPSPAQAASTKRAPSPSPAPALEQHDSAPLPDEGPQEFEQLAAFGETCDSSEDELLEEEASRPIEADAPQSDGDDGSDEDNVEDSGPDADLASPTFDAEQAPTPSSPPLTQPLGDFLRAEISEGDVSSLDLDAVPGLELERALQSGDENSELDLDGPPIRVGRLAAEPQVLPIEEEPRPEEEREGEELHPDAVEEPEEPDDLVDDLPLNEDASATTEEDSSTTDEEVKLQVEPEPSTLLEVVTTQVDAVEVDPPQTPVAFAGEVEIADEVLEAEVEEDLLSLEPRDDSGHVLVKSEPAIELSSEDPPPATSELEIESEPLESPASPISVVPDSEPDVSLSASPLRPSTLPTTATPLPSSSPPPSDPSTPSLEASTRAALIASTLTAAPTVQRHLSKQTSLVRPRIAATPSIAPIPPPLTTVRPAVKSRIPSSLAPRAAPLAAPTKPAGPPRVSRLMQPTATSSARTVIQKRPTIAGSLRPASVSKPSAPAARAPVAAPPPPAETSRPGSAASSSSASSLSASSSSGLPKPTTLQPRTGLKPPSESKLRRPLPPAILSHTHSAPTLLQPTPLPTIASPVRASPARLPRPPPLPLPLPAVASPAKASPARLPRPPPLEPRVASAPIASPARLPRPPPLTSFANNDQRSPERARKALRVGETRAAAETVPVRLTSTSAIHPPPQRSFSNPALLPSSFPRSPSKTRLLAPTSLTSSLPTSSSTSSLLTAPAERLDTDVVLDVFRPLAAPLPRPKALAAPPPPAPPIAPVEALVEPLRATPLPRPTRKTLALAAAAHSASLLALNPLPPPPSPSIVSSQSTSTPAPTFNPIPTLTQEQWAQLTQRHTRKNKAHFNKLTVDELVIDQMRPPSPTSKIRKSVPEDGSGESREGRAKKRRTALRSSLGGSGDAEDDDDEVQVREEPRVVLAPVSHFRGAGDDEEYTSPVRGGKGKKKSVGDAAEARERRRVKWDKALVFEGPVRPHGESKPILKRVPLDKYGNSLITTGGFARPAAVTIVKRIYLDDE